MIFVSIVVPYVIYSGKNYSYKYSKDEVCEKRNSWTIRLFFLIFFVLLMLRDIAIGTDLKEYQNIFNRCIYLDFRDLPNLRWEIGYTTYNKVVAIISKEYRIFLIITAAMILFPIYKLYIREKAYSVLLIALFINMPCFVMVFSGLRQSIAISIGIFVFMAIEKKKHCLSILLIILAMMFHSSALVLVLLYPAFLLKIKTKHLLFLIPIMIVFYIYRIQIFTYALKYLPERYTQFYGEVQLSNSYGMLFLFLLFISFSFVFLDEAEMTTRDFFLRNILLIATIFQFFVPIHGLIQRCSYYFLIFVPVSLLSVVRAPKKWLKEFSNLAVVVMVVFFITYFFYNAMYSTNNLLNVFPYKFME